MSAPLPAIDAAPYVKRLRALADELERAAGQAPPQAAAQLPVARLIELLEDLRTVELEGLATKLAPIVDRLRAAMSTPGLVAALHEAVAALRSLPGDGESPPPGDGEGPPPGEGESPRPRRWRWAFWR